MFQIKYDWSKMMYRFFGLLAKQTGKGGKMENCFLKNRCLHNLRLSNDLEAKKKVQKQKYVNVEEIIFKKCNYIPSSFCISKLSSKIIKGVLFVQRNVNPKRFIHVTK